MPAPIVLSTLTPETKRVPNPPEGQPVIATKAEFRDGTRVTEVITPPPSGSVDWEARLARTGSGTPDPSFDPATDMTYLGAFRIPNFNNSVTSTADKRSMAYMPPNGSNGPNGSIFIAGQYAVAEVQAPSTGTSMDYASLPEATVLQNFVRVYDLAPIPDASGSTVKKTRIGSMKVVAGKLFMSFYNDYDNSGSNDFNTLICNNPSDLANSSYQGFLDRAQNDLGSRYTMEIPAAWQSTFGRTHFSGVNSELSIIGRSSHGHALIAWSPGEVQPADTAVPAELWVRYGNFTTVNNWSEWNAEVTAHYESELGLASGGMKAFLNSDPATRITSFDHLPLPPDSARKTSGSLISRTGFGFIPPGSDTVVYVGNNGGMRYGAGYKVYQIESGTNAGETSGGAPWSRFDWDNMIWTMNLNDIAGAVNAYDPDYIEYGIFDSNRWVTAGLFRPQGLIVSGDFDSASGKVYLLHDGIPFDQFSTQFIVSVYQVGQ